MQHACASNLFFEQACRSVEDMCGLAEDLKASTLIIRLSLPNQSEQIAPIQRKYVEQAICNILVSTTSVASCLAALSRFCRSFTRDVKVSEAEYAAPLFDEITQVFMVARPMSVSLDAADRAQVQQGLRLLSSATDAQGTLAEAFHKFPTVRDQLRESFQQLDMQFQAGEVWLSNLQKCCTFFETLSSSLQQQAFHDHVTAVETNLSFFVRRRQLQSPPDVQAKQAD